MAWTDKGSQTLKSDSLLLATACIWGFAFVAQRMGMEHVGPFGFNGVRFALGSLVLLPLLYKNHRENREPTRQHPRLFSLKSLAGGLAAGLILFTGASFQQVAMIYTTAGNAGFITGLYVIIVPIIGIALKHHTHAGTWIGAVLAAAGMYLLSVTERFTISPGDLLVLVGAFFWACHVHIIGWLSPRHDPLKLAIWQYAVCSILSMAVTLIFEQNTLVMYEAAFVPILYGGIMSVGVAYTLQIIAQKRARPSHAAIILSLEAVFAAIGGWAVLGEVLSARAMAGCSLMFCGMLISQLWKVTRKAVGSSSP